MQHKSSVFRTLSLLLTLIFALTIFSACGTAEPDSTEPSDTESSGLFPPAEDGSSEPEEDGSSDPATSDGTGESTEEAPTGSTEEFDTENGGTKTDTDSDTSSETSNTSTDTDKTPPSTSEFQAQESVSFKKLELKGKTAVSSAPEVADCKVQSNAITVYAHATGSATITVTDYFGFTAEIEVTVDAAAKKMTCNPIPCKTDFIEVGMDYGAKGDGIANDTQAFQNALNAAKPGETVYVYPGRYSVSLLTMTEGVTLKMYTTMTDAKTGYTKDIASDFIRKRIAILSGTRILNCKNNTPGRNGSSNFKIIGGAFDVNLTDRSTLIFGNAKNISIENVIFKDIKNNHIIQLTGCTNATVKNCMFAGFVCGSAFTREVVQVEPSTPGATGTAATAPITFGEGEFFLPENVTITECYFGKSDEAGPPLMAIGHHSQVGGANVTNFKITNNLFDECLYAAIRYNNLVNVEITGNTFRSTAAYKNATQYTETVDPAFIHFYHHNGRTSYTNQNGSTVIRASAEEQAGLHNIRIENNTFEIAQGSDKRIMRYTGLGMKPGAVYLTGYRQDSYLGTSYSLSGYRPVTNYASDISFSNNTVRFTGKPTYSDWYLNLDPIYGLTTTGNKIEMASGVSFTGGTNGQIINAASDTEQKTITISAKNSSRSITVKCGAKQHTFTATASLTLKLELSTGGFLQSVTSDQVGNLTVTLAPDSGYQFDKMTTSSGGAVSSNISVSSSSTYKILFKK